MQLLAVVALFLRLAAFVSASTSASTSTSSSHAWEPARDLDALARLTPKSALPPPSSLQPKYVALGVGTQNYTCASASDKHVPSANGALGETLPGRPSWHRSSALTRTSSALRHRNGSQGQPARC